ncbi:hypothetical protein PROFUN_04663 [Planoprotostelium fungivorum]|uniref:Protein kinase domain-containing protein n=1 Tax=Planoprotostelium fungivorum TaxID=1890364 RepID=A0A2P6NUM7_9EUKA|nr:hypothetical protein PROFUN_04663 [Planoprotostelium fungivorum]
MSANSDSGNEPDALRKKSKDKKGLFKTISNLLWGQDEQNRQSEDSHQRRVMFDQQAEERRTSIAPKEDLREKDSGSGTPTMGSAVTSRSGSKRNSLEVRKFTGEDEPEDQVETAVEPELTAEDVKVITVRSEQYLQKRQSTIKMRKLLFPCTSVEDLPKDLKKMARATKIPDDVLNANLDSLLNVLHFVTKKVYASRSTHKLIADQSKGGDKKLVERAVPAVVRRQSDPDVPLATVGVKRLSVSQKDSVDIDEGKVDDEVASGRADVKAMSHLSSPSTASPMIHIRSSADRTKHDKTGGVEIQQKNPKELYKGLKKTGRGGFGTVFVGKSFQDGKRTAIKRMQHSSRKEKLDNLNEYRHTNMCSGHPNIVKMTAAYEYKDECWLVMEFMEGGTLTEARRGHDFDESEIAYVAKELLKGLEHIHKMKLVHRDVKSENIMMTINGDIKLIDFGLCIEHQLIRPTMVGSPYWMPPEMINRQMHSYAADIWSLGVSLLELANKPGHGTSNKVKMMFLTATVGRLKPFDNPTKWTSVFHDFVSKCLEFDQDKRPLTEELLQHPFIQSSTQTKRVMQKILSEIFLQKAIGLM